MLSRKENIKILLGMLIVASIFVFIAVSSYVEKTQNYDNLINSDTKFSESIPDNYSDEIVDPAQLNGSQVKIDKSGNVVGFTLKINAIQSFCLIKDKLISNGWNYVESGSASSASFYKDEGKYRWLFLNCIDVGGESSVVLTSN